MKVWGELEGAQLEQLVGDPVDATPTGRIYMDITIPSAAVPKIWTGTVWRPFSLGQSAATVSQNGGKACVVDWSQGLNQQVTLNDNCVISFINPVSGYEHILVVTQAATVTGGVPAEWTYVFDMPDQDAKGLPYQPIMMRGGNATYRWFYKPGIRAGYNNVPPLSQGFQGVSAAGSGLAMAKQENLFIMGRSTSPFLTLGILSPNVNPLLQTPQRTCAAPTTLSPGAAATAVAIAPDGRTMFAANGTTPFLSACSVYAENENGTFAAPTALAGAANAVAVNPLGTFVAAGHATTPFVSILPWNGSAGWGTKWTGPSSLPAAAVTAVEFSPLNDYVATACQSTPFLQVWNITANSTTGFWGSICGNPTTLPAGGPPGSSPVGGKGLAWRPQGDFIAMAMSVTPFIYVVPFNRATGTFGTALTATAIAGSTQATSVRWTPDGQYLIVAGTSFIVVYDFAAKNLLSLCTFDGGAYTASQINDFDVSPGGDYALFNSNSSPFGFHYALPWKTKNYVRLL